MTEKARLDELVLEKVFGRVVTDQYSLCGEFTVASEVAMKGFIRDYPNQQPPDTCPHYSIDVSAAWEVIEVMKFKGYTPTLNGAEEKSLGVAQRIAFVGDWHCCFKSADGEFYRSYAKTAPEAICKAALLAVMGK